jgi:hypothetical protein
METFADKYQFKNYVRKQAVELSINGDFFDKLFANVFIEIYEKEKLTDCIMKMLNIRITDIIINEVLRVGKKNKGDFLILFEDYQKINSELSEIALRIERHCLNKNKQCKKDGSCILDLAHYPYLCSRTENIDLKTFRPEQVLKPEFLLFIESHFGKHGLYFLYNQEYELMYVGKSENLGSTMLDTIWENNINGFVSVALTKTISDTHIYEPYYIVKYNPLLNSHIKNVDSLSVSLPELEQTEKVKIFER